MAQPDEPTQFFVPMGGDSLWVGMYEPPTDASPAQGLVLIPGFAAVGQDVLGLGRSLSELGSYVFVLQPRGHGPSSGWATFSNALEDVGAVLEWLRTTETLPARARGPVALGGHSWGGGIALAYAAEHPEVGRVVAIAASDHGVFIRRVDEDPDYGESFRTGLGALQASGDLVRFDVEADFAELRSDWKRHDLATIAPRLADRDLLLIVGWDDESVEVEYQVLPFYRALGRAEAKTVRILGYQDDHSFGSSRSQIVGAIHDWLREEP
ncbi:MAG: alpha/beta fold hydrolase [Candidatus Eisenbacteria bacterium]|uniref:Alpha/beta fold hydrolase n=1 Tax=Eiseniibacteriota bacterium TaxID=2212470 RepID=A0A956NCI9_UNCEI|nr:alpha/beta fold hydrolase [Candidatus Eisenbacteria bacterium]